MNSAISPLQNGEIECKMVKLSAKQWLTAPTKLSLDKQNGGKQLNEDWNAQKDLITALNTKLSKIYKKIVIAKCVRWEKKHKSRKREIHTLELDWIEISMPEPITTAWQNHSWKSKL